MRSAKSSASLFLLLFTFILPPSRNDNPSRVKPWLDRVQKRKTGPILADSRFLKCQNIGPKIGFFEGEFGRWKSHHQYFGILRYKSYQKVHLNRTKKSLSSQGLKTCFRDIIMLVMLEYSYAGMNNRKCIIAILVCQLHTRDWRDQLLEVRDETETLATSKPRPRPRLWIWPKSRPIPRPRPWNWPETETFTETLLKKVAVKGYQNRPKPLNRDRDSEYL